MCVQHHQWSNRREGLHFTYVVIIITIIPESVKVWPTFEIYFHNTSFKHVVINYDNTLGSQKFCIY